MSNRFKQSIDNLQTKAAINEKTETKSEKTEPAINNTVLDNILEAIPKETQRKNYAFYLSNEIAEAITKVAKQKGISKSKLVENILKQVLLGGVLSDK